MRYIADLHEFEMVDDVYYCKCAEVCTAKNGNIYTKLDLVDKSGIIKGFKWNSDNTLAADVQKQYVRIKGTVGRYKDDLNLTVNAITIAKDSEFSPEDYVAQTKWDKNAMMDRIMQMIESVETKHFRELLLLFFRDDAELRERFSEGTAAKTIHHNFNGGLLEHTLWVATSSRNLANQYSGVNKDLLTTAALLHDVGKVVELIPAPDCDYTVEGSLLGHVVIGTLMIHDRAKLIKDFPHDDLVKLEHCILAHHGKLEYGSPKVPALTESIILSMADNLDAKVFVAESLLEKEKDKNGWTPYSSILDTRIHEG